MRPTFDASLIADLKKRVILHNEANPTTKVKLAELRKVYEQGFRRSNPAHRAMGRVDAHLAGLAKADEFDDAEHPRGENGRFSSKGGGVEDFMPAAEAIHRNLQEKHAGYRALTSDVMPEQRYEAAGNLVRDIGSLAAGAAVVSGMARGANSWIERLASKTLSSVAGNAAGAGAALSSETVQAGLNAIHRKVPFIKPMSEATMRSVRSGAGNAGTKAGAFVGRNVVRGASAVVRGALGVAGNEGISEAATQKMKDIRAHHARMGTDPKVAETLAARAGARLDRRIKFSRKALAFGAMAGGLGLLVRQQIQGTAFDPGVIGRSVDGFSYRIIAKSAADSDELGAAFKHMTRSLAKASGPVAGSIDGLSAWLANGGGDDELRKNAFATWGKASIGLFSGAAAALGAAAGGGGALAASHIAGKRGNPNHGKDGRFTSGDKAVGGVGALLGGAAAGLAVYAALRRHNAKAFTAIVERLQNHISSSVAKTTAGTSPRVKAFAATRAKRVAELMDKHPSFAKDRAEWKHLQEHGASAEPALRAKLEAVYHGRIADILSAYPDTILPGKSGGVRLGDLVTSRGTATRGIVLKNAVERALENGMTRKELAAGTKGLPVASQVMELFDKKVAAVADVPSAIQAHHAKIEVARTKMEAAESALATAQEQHAVADAAVKIAPEGPEAEAAKVKLTAASNTAAAASKKRDAAVRAHDNLKASPQGIKDPFTGEPLVPPTKPEIDLKVEALRQDVQQKADKLFDGELKTHVASEVERLSHRFNQLLAARAAKGARDGVPSRIRGIVEDLADEHARVELANKRVIAAEIAHAANERDLRDLAAASVAAQKKGIPKGMTAARALDVRGREAEILKSHGKTKADLDFEQGEYHAAAAHQAAAAAMVRDALAAGAEGVKATGRKGGFLPHELRRDLNRAMDGVAGPLKSFLKSPSTKKLKEYAASMKDSAFENIKTGAVKTKDALKAGAKQSYRDLFTRENASGERTFSVARTIRNASLIGGGVEAVRQATKDVRDALKGDAAARKRLRAHIEDETDPVTGAGYFGLSIEHPDEKGERTLLWGERMDGETSAPKPLIAGAKMSVVRARVKAHAEEIKRQQSQSQNQQKQRNGGQANPDLDLGSKKQEVDAAVAKMDATQGQTEKVDTGMNGPGLRLRASTDATHNSAAGAVIPKVRELVGKGALTGAAYHAALAGLFSPQGRVLQVKQAYRHLVGGDKDAPIFGDAAAFKAQDKGDVVKALHAEVDRIATRSAPTTSAQVANMRRAVGVVGAARGLSSDQMSPIHEKIEALNAGTRSAPLPPAGPPAPAGPAPGTAVVVSAPSVPLAEPIPSSAVSKDHRKDWARGQEHHMALSQKAAWIVAGKIGIEHPHDVEVLGGLIHQAARTISEAHDLEPSLSIRAAANAIASRGMREDGDGRAQAAMNLFSKGGALEDADLRARMAMQARKIKAETGLGKAILLDDIDALAKVSFGEFAEALHPRAAAGALGGGEFISDSVGQMHGSVGGRAVGEGIEAGGKAAAKGERVAGKTTQAWYNPVRFGNEFGGALGSEAAIAGVRALLPAPVRIAARLAVWGAEGVGALAGGVGGSVGGEKLGQAGEAASGSKVERYKPPAESTGEQLAGTVGSIVGGIAGNAIGGVGGLVTGPGAIPASIAGGAVLGYAGDYAGRAAYRFFEGYDQPSVDKAMTRFGGSRNGGTA